MKSAEEWFQEYGGIQSDVAAVVTRKGIRAIQADALRWAAAIARDTGDIDSIEAKANDLETQ